MSKAVVIPQFTESQAKALEGLQNAMGGFLTAIINCDDTGIPLADAFAAIGVEIPLMLRPLLNALADKLPSKNGDC